MGSWLSISNKTDHKGNTTKIIQVLAEWYHRRESLGIAKHVRMNFALCSITSIGGLGERMRWGSSFWRVNSQILLVGAVSCYVNGASEAEILKKTHILWNNTNTILWHEFLKVHFFYTTTIFQFPSLGFSKPIVELRPKRGQNGRCRRSACRFWLTSKRNRPGGVREQTTRRRYQDKYYPISPRYGEGSKAHLISHMAHSNVASSNFKTQRKYGFELWTKNFMKITLC